VFDQGWAQWMVAGNKTFVPCVEPLKEHAVCKESVLPTHTTVADMAGQYEIPRSIKVEAVVEGLQRRGVEVVYVGHTLVSGDNRYLRAAVEASAVLVAVERMSARRDALANAAPRVWIGVDDILLGVASHSEQDVVAARFPSCFHKAPSSLDLFH